MITEWSRPTKYLVGTGLVLLGIYFLYISRSVLPLLVLAALLAVIVRPAIVWLIERARWPRGLAVAVVYLLVAILIPVTLVLAIPALIEAVRYVLSIDYGNAIEAVTGWLRTTLTNLKNAPLPPGPLDLYIDQTVDTFLAELGRETTMETVELPSVATVLRSLTSALTTTFRTAAGLVGAVGTRVALGLFIFLASIYMSLSLHTFHDGFLRAVPEAYRWEIDLLMARLGRMWAAFFRGQLVLMLVIGLISWIGLTILGVPGALYLGIVAGLLELIPNLGPIIATIPAVIVALLQGSSYLPLSTPWFALVVVLFYILVQQLENNLIVPRVLGGAVELPPLVVMTGVLVGAEFAGLLGALLATPVIASLREIVRYAYRKIQGLDPFPPEEHKPPSPDRTPSRLRTWFQNATRLRFPGSRRARAYPDQKTE